MRLEAALALLHVRRLREQRFLKTLFAGYFVMIGHVGLIRKTSLLSGIRCIIISLCQIVRNLFILPETCLECLTELSVLARLAREASIGDLDVGVATSAVLRIHDRLRMNVRVLLGLELLSVRHVR